LCARPSLPPPSPPTGLDLGLPDRYGHFIDGEFVEPLEGQYFDNVSPIDGKTFIQAARGSKADVDHAVECANAAFQNTWKNTSVTERSNMLLKIADIIEANADRLAQIETIDNGKVREEKRQEREKTFYLVVVLCW
jgi:acyl-CoA reductase-like NAD-dependent aldehyde dehydrogenase